MNDRELMQQALKLALEALEKHGKAPIDWACKECVPYSDILKDGFQCRYHGAITAIREALAQQQSAERVEPVAVYVGETWCGSVVRLYEDLPLETPLYTSPPQRKPLTRPQINQMMADAGWQNSAIRQADLDKVEKVARAIEAAHGIKGGA